MPDEFIPIAEGAAVIHPLTDEIPRQALIQARVWRDRGCTIPVSVKISARCSYDQAFPARVRQRLDAAADYQAFLPEEVFRPCSSWHRRSDKGVMATIPGARCAAALVALRLPPAAIVDALMTEVGLDQRQATMAAFAARQLSGDIDCPEGSHA